MDLSIIIVSYNTEDLLVDCINSIKTKTYGLKYEIIVIDNGSSDESAKKALGLGANVVRNSTNSGFATANNQGISKSKGEFILFLNSDTIISTNLLYEMVLWMRKNLEAGVITCGLKNQDGSIQATGGYFPTLLRVFSWMTIQDIPYTDKVIKPFHPLHSKSGFAKGENFYSDKKELDWVTGAFLLTRENIMKKIGGWDQSFFMYVEEVDLCFRIKKLGYKVWYLPKWYITHLGGASGKGFGDSLLKEYEGIKKFYKKHYPRWQLPILRILLKIGALGRIILFGILEGKDSARIYAKAFKIA